MKNRGTRRTWLWLLLAVILAGFIAYFITSRNSGKPEKPLITEKPTSLETQEPSEKPQEPLFGQNIEEPPLQSLSQEDYCATIKENMTEFFHHLDQMEYFQDLNPKIDAYARFKAILRLSTEWPPIPAGEGTDPSIMIRNVYHLSRILSKKDIQLIREVLRNEKGAMEINLAMLYRWLNVDDYCPDPDPLRPRMDVVYQYAGFFLNTIGGRAYLFRRSPNFRLLTSYYCLLIVHEADKRGKNNYGIDLLPYIAPLREEIVHYPDFQFGSEYINTLNTIEDYYLRKR